MRIIIISDGKYGDRAYETVKNIFPETEFLTIPPENPTVLIEEYDFPPDISQKIESADLVISYIRHLDINLELAYFDKPTIIAINFGKGFLTQLTDINPKTVMPNTMCRLLPQTGIREIDEFADRFGVPEFSVKLIKKGNKYFFDKIEISRESPCGATRRTVSDLVGEEVCEAVLDRFGLNVSRECREPVSVLLRRSHMGESAAALHRLVLLDYLKEKYPPIFGEGVISTEYYTEKKKEFYEDRSINIFRSG